MKTQTGSCTCCGGDNKEVKVIEERKLCSECIIKIREKVLSYLFAKPKIKRRPLRGE